MGVRVASRPGGRKNRLTSTLFVEIRRGGLKGGPLMIGMVKSGNLDETLEEVKKAKRFVEQLVGAA
jgi:hypothetical protein